MEVSVIIPTKDEEKAIAQVIHDIPKEYEIIVIDKSKDRTAEIAKKEGAKVIIQKTDGKGNAMKEAAKAAKGDIIVFVDGDGTYDIPSIKKLVSKINGADAVYGVRIPEKGAMSLSHKFGNFMLKSLATVMYQKTSDLLTGFIAIKKDVFNSLNLESEGFAVETELFIKLSKNDYKIAEVNTPYYKRIGESVLNTFGDGWVVLKTLFKYYFKKS